MQRCEKWGACVCSKGAHEIEISINDDTLNIQIVIISSYDSYNIGKQFINIEYAK
jgi:hypothetical protein